MKRSVVPFAPLLAISLAPADTLAEAPKDDSIVSFQDFHFVPLDPATKLSLGDFEHKPMVITRGGDTAVKITPIASKQAQKRLAFGIRHRDKGTHSFELEFVGSDGGHVLSFPCNGRDAKGSDAPLEKACYTDDACILLGVAPLPGSLNVVPSFANSKSWSLDILRDGVLVHRSKGLTGGITIPDFEGEPESGKRETLGVELEYGRVRDDAWTVVVHHEGHTVLVTPDNAQAFAGLPDVSLRTKGLRKIEIVDVE